jgi:hypothetical protein
MNIPDMLIVAVPIKTNYMGADTGGMEYISYFLMITGMMLIVFLLITDSDDKKKPLIQD